MTTARRTNQITDEFNRPVPGAQVYVYNFDGSLATLTSDGTIPLANPVLTDTFGNYSYYALVGYYREDVWFNGSKRWSENNIEIGVVTTTPSGTAANARTVMAAIGAPLASQSAILTESGREGAFVFDSSNFVTKLGAPLATIDPQQGIYVAPASDPTGASGAWVRVLSVPSCVQASWFGAVGDGATDDYAAVNAAVAYLVSIGGGTLLFGAKTYNISATLTWSGAGITLEGAGANVQALSSALNTILLFPNSATQTGCINPKNGALGKGFGSRVRNLVIKGNNGVAVSAANAKLGLGSGLLVQVYGIFENVIAMHCEGNGIYALSAPSVSDDSIACSGAVFTNCIGYGCGNNGRATYGVDSNTLNFIGGGAQQNTQFADYINGLQGSTIVGPSYEGNLGGCLRFGDLTGNNRVYGATKQGDVALTVQFDLGGPANNKVDFQTAEGTPGNVDYVITDNSLSKQNDVTLNGVERTRRMGADGVNGTINVTTTGDLNVRNSAKIILDDGPVTSHWDIYNSAGTLLFFTDQSVGVNFYSASAITFSYDASGLNIASGKVLKVAGSTVLTATALSLGTLTVATLPASPAVGTKAFVTDANAATFGSAVVGGGANKVPVFYDGAWKIG